MNRRELIEHRRVVETLTRSQFDEYMQSLSDPETFQKLKWNAIRNEIYRAVYWSEKLPNLNEMDLRDIPISEFSSYEPYLIQAQTELVSPISGSSILWWTRSSGTTSINGKRFPLNEAKKRESQTFRTITTHTVLKRTQGAESARILWFYGFQPVPMPKTGIPVGLGGSFNRIHGHLGEAETSVVPQKIYQSHETFMKWGPAYALATDLVSINGLFGFPISVFLEALNENFSFYRDIIFGREPLPEDFPALDIDEGRLDEISALVPSSRPFNVRELWPRLRTIYCAKTSSAKLFLKLLEPFLEPSVEVVHAAFPASECVCALPSLNSLDGGPVSPLLGIVEFLEEGRSVEKQYLLNSWELEVGKTYETFVTSSIGLVRYRMKDLVKCIAFEGRAPIIQFLQKQGSVVPLRAFALSEPELVEAVARSGFLVQGRWVFLPVAEYDQLILVVEDKSLPMAVLQTELEKQIRSLHSTYNNYRETGALKPLEVRHRPSEDMFWARFPDTRGAQMKMIYVLSTP